MKSSVLHSAIRDKPAPNSIPLTPVYNSKEIQEAVTVAAWPSTTSARIHPATTTSGPNRATPTAMNTTLHPAASQGLGHLGAGASSAA